ncbi:MAG: hypothetical protein GY937_27675 [bacterium]|nr:hypothetical protein [bacterium]
MNSKPDGAAQESEVSHSSAELSVRIQGFTSTDREPYGGCGEGSRNGRQEQGILLDPGASNTARRPTAHLWGSPGQADLKRVPRDADNRERAVDPGPGLWGGS